MPTLAAETPDNKFETAGPVGALRSSAVQLGGRGAARRAAVTAQRPGPAHILLAPETPRQGFTTPVREMLAPSNLFWRPSL